MGNTEDKYEERRQNAKGEGLKLTDRFAREKERRQPRNTKRDIFVIISSNRANLLMHATLKFVSKFVVVLRLSPFWRLSAFFPSLCLMPPPSLALAEAFLCATVGRGHSLDPGVCGQSGFRTTTPNTHSTLIACSHARTNAHTHAYRVCKTLFISGLEKLTSSHVALCVWVWVLYVCMCGGVCEGDCVRILWHNTCATITCTCVENYCGLCTLLFSRGVSKGVESFTSSCVQDVCMCVGVCMCGVWCMCTMWAL